MVKVTVLGLWFRLCAWLLLLTVRGCPIDVRLDTSRWVDSLSCPIASDNTGLRRPGDEVVEELPLPTSISVSAPLCFSVISPATSSSTSHHHTTCSLRALHSMRPKVFLRFWRCSSSGPASLRIRVWHGRACLLEQTDNLHLPRISSQHHNACFQ